MMNIGLHCRLAGQPGRSWPSAALSIMPKAMTVSGSPPEPPLPSIGISTTLPKDGLTPHQMERGEFIAAFGSVFEHSWIAEAVFDGEMGLPRDHAPGLHAAMAQVFRHADQDKRRDVLLAHPDLAGKLAAAGR